MMSDILNLDGVEIRKNESKRVNLKVTKLPSGHDIEIVAHIHRATESGPCILLLGGVHGDEVNGVEIVRRLVSDQYFKGLQRGTIIAIPVLNVFGFINFSREVRDGKDVNRSFPGSFSGSLASRIAKTVMAKLMPIVDVILDFHTGGAARYNYPQVRYTTGDQLSLEYARIFGAPFTIEKDPIAKSLRKYAFRDKKACLVFEGGQSLQLDELSINCAIEGSLRVLYYLDMISGNSKKGPTRVFRKSTWVRASVSGLFLSRKNSGSDIQKNDIIGEINEPYGLKKTLIKAHRSGTLICHNNAPVVTQGDALFNIAYNEI